MTHTWTQTFSILEISKKSFLDIKLRLAAVNMLHEYLTLDDDKQEIIIFGTVALKAEM